MLLPPHEIPLLPFFHVFQKELKHRVFGEAFLSYPHTLILVLLVPLALCIIPIKAVMILHCHYSFLFIILSGRYYILLHFACLPNT